MTLSLFARPIAAAAALVFTAGTALADEFVDRANAFYRTIQPAKRSDSVLLPLLAKMDAVPASAATLEKAMLLPAGTSGWAAAESWANAAPQRAVLDALTAVTNESNIEEAMAFGQPYGADALGATSEGIQMIQLGLYTELGDPPMLAGAKFLYLPALERAECLAHVEATRLASQGKFEDAIQVMVHWLFFARQMADRQMYQECRWGVRSMIAALERIRDLAYTDSRAATKTLNADSLAKVREQLRQQGGYLRPDRIRFPAGNRLAAEQAVSMVFGAGGRPGDTFGQTMAQLASTQRPLRLFAEAARWHSVAEGHANQNESRAELTKVFNDLTARWPLEAFDPRHDSTPDIENMDRDRFAVLTAVLPDMTPLFADRMALNTQLIGTRSALGILGFASVARNFPPVIESLRPRFLQTIDADPFNPDRGNGKQPPLKYFVPIRDQKHKFGTGPAFPHAVSVVTGSQNFEVSLGEDQFVLYSVGPNGDAEWAENVTGDPQSDAIGDVLLWPPVLSLLRQHMVQNGELN